MYLSLILYIHVHTLSYTLNIFNGYDKKAFEDLFFLQKIVGLAKVYMNTHVLMRHSSEWTFPKFMV